jgi:hypothetical protein
VDFPWCKVSAKDMTVDEETIARDVLFFLIFFAIAAAVGIVAVPFAVKAAVAVLLVAAYAYYVRRALASGARSKTCRSVSPCGASAPGPRRGPSPASSSSPSPL